MPRRRLRLPSSAGEHRLRCNLARTRVLAASLVATAVFMAYPALVAATPVLSAPDSSPVVTLLETAAVHAYPGASAPTIAYIKPTRPITHNPSVLPVIGTASAQGHAWVRVRLPMRPDGSTGWITTNGTRSSSDPWYIAVSLAKRQASIYEHGLIVRQWPVVVGKPSTPTPPGSFFVTEIVHEGYGIVSGPYAMLTSDYSNVLFSFEGGPGQIALHGRVGLMADPLGSAASHGCVRFLNADIAWLATHVPAGTSVVIS